MFESQSAEVFDVAIDIGGDDVFPHLCSAFFQGISLARAARVRVSYVSTDYTHVCLAIL